MATTQTMSMASLSPPPPRTKREGDISDAFASLSGLAAAPLPDYYRQLKLDISRGHEEEIKAGWRRLLEALRVENAAVAAQGSDVVPQLEFGNLEEDLRRLEPDIRKRGVAVVRGVIPEHEARAYKYEIEDYVRKNPHTKGFPADNPQVWELYWSAPQLKARSHPNFVKLQKTLMKKLWHASPDAAISLSHPVTYCDRLRIRMPGDAKFALGPHQDGGSVERWDPKGYGRGRVYESVLKGKWEEYDPWDATGRIDAAMNLHDGLGACSMFRMFQGWLSMSHCGPNKGTLLVNPLVRLAMSYTLLRPFFKPRRRPGEALGDDGFLSEDNWVFTGGEDMTSELQGATPGHGQEFPPGKELHPHLELDKTMVHMPDVKPGDYVIWHCDTIHAVDKVHRGDSDASVMYIPICPLTELNAHGLVEQRECFLSGVPSPDFPGGKGESEHVDRPGKETIMTKEGLAGMGLEEFEAVGEEEDANDGGRRIVKLANEILGFE